jgi:hypothetical protein
MLVDHYKHRLVPQCDFASAMFGLTCCQPPLARGCDEGAWPEDIDDHFGINVTKIGRAATDSEVVAQLGAGSPVEVYYAWTGGGAHVALIAGRSPNGDYLVLDPWYGQGTRSPESVRTGYGGGSWDASYWTQGT